MKRAVFSIGLLCCIHSLFGQDRDLKFEVASVRPSTSVNSLFSGGPGTATPDQVRWTAYTLTNLIAQAYSVSESYVEWAGTQNPTRFDISANLGAATTKIQFTYMLQNLLRERFGLQVHRVARMVSGYELTVAKGGPKLAASGPLSATVPQHSGVKADRDGFPGLPLGRPLAARKTSGEHTRVTGIQQTTQDIILIVRSELKGAPVVDKTGLEGNYDFKLHFATRPSIVAFLQKDRAARGIEDPSLNATDPTPAPELSAALKEQLGLDLKAMKVAVDFIVVDSARKLPTEN